MTRTRLTDPVSVARVKSAGSQDRSHINPRGTATLKTEPVMDACRPHRSSSIVRIPLHISERKVLLGMFDVLAVNGALLLVVWLRLERRISYAVFVQHPIWFILLTALWGFFALSLDTYDLRAASNVRTSWARVIQAALPTWLAYVAIPFITPILHSSRLTLALSLCLLLALLALGRSLYAIILVQPVFQRRAIVIGAGWAGRAIVQALREHGDGSYQVVGYVDDDPRKQGAVAADSMGWAEWKSGTRDSASPQQLSFGSLLVLGDRHALKRLASQHDVRTLILAITDEIDGELLQVLMDCLELGVEIIPMPVLYEQLARRVPVDHVGENWYVAVPIHHPGTQALWPVAKRIMDILLASLGLVCLAIVLPFIAAAIYLDSPGPIFYTQLRVGKGGRLFNLFKFRSMAPDAEKDEAVWAQKDDSRVTRVGRWLRRTHLDEFPQFLNVLRGEMSAVGPRPERPEFLEALTKEIPFYRVRHAAKPGMAGWGLVNQGYGSSKRDALLKLQYDLYYIKHQSLWLDTVILLRAIVDTIALRGR